MLPNTVISLRVISPPPTSIWCLWSALHCLVSHPRETGTAYSQVREPSVLLRMTSLLRVIVDSPPFSEISFLCLKFFHKPTKSKHLALPQPHFFCFWGLTSSHASSGTLKSQRNSVLCAFAPSHLTPRLSSSPWITPIYPLRFISVTNLRIIRQ